MQINRTVQITIKEGVLSGDLKLPEATNAMVLFAHGSGSSRLSPRNKFVAEQFNKAGFGTFLMDLLTEKEEAIDNFTRHLRFDIPLLARRLGLAIEWLRATSETSSFSIGLFGASTGSAAGIIAAAEARTKVLAVVSRGGRPDLADSHLAILEAPTLLIVGGCDETVIALNEIAMAKMHCPRKLNIVPGATHLFEEPGTLDQVAQLATSWFTQYTSPPNSQSSRYAPVRL